MFGFLFVIVFVFGFFFGGGGCPKYLFTIEWEATRVSPHLRCMEQLGLNMLNAYSKYIISKLYRRCLGIYQIGINLNQLMIIYTDSLKFSFPNK